MTEPKPLTERELLGLLEWNTKEEILDELRERGLIADDPVDPDLLEAREIATDHAAKFGHDYVRYPDDDAAVVQIAFAAIKRGRQLEQPKPLTREMVATAMLKVWGGVPHWAQAYAPSLHTALVEQMK